VDSGPGRTAHLLNTFLFGVGLLYALVIPPTFTSTLAFRSLSFSTAYNVFMYPINVLEHFYHASASYPFVLALVLAWTSLPEVVFLEVLFERHAKRSSGALLVFYIINLAAGTLSVVIGGS
jgi:predicted PurR-regulated permease PerM